jgi:2,3-bisphosphoglycerate-dependent phosphoglycerate mutase
MTELFIIRHGDYIFDETQQPMDRGLSEQGIAQAERLRDRLATDRQLEASVLIASPLARADQTAKIIAPALKLPVITDPDLEEWNNYDGSPESRQFEADLKDTPYNRLQYVVPFPGALSYAQFASRVCHRLYEIAQKYEGQTIVIVAHGGIIECSFIYAYNLNPLAPAPVMLNLDPYYTSITRWTKKDDPRNIPWRLVTYNDYAHLNE